MDRSLMTLFGDQKKLRVASEEVGRVAGDVDGNGRESGGGSGRGEVVETLGEKIVRLAGVASAIHIGRESLGDRAGWVDGSGAMGGFMEEGAL